MKDYKTGERMMISLWMMMDMDTEIMVGKSGKSMIKMLMALKNARRESLM